ncbi:MAG: hypothetical protein IH888_05185 [Planctomycetes bacterium]|nr:hypothetical protein [Planctomycetota bacterium]
MPPRGRSFRTLLLGLTLAAVASFTASSAFASSILLSANNQPAGTQLVANCCGNCVPGVPCCGYCTPAQKQN